MFRILIPCLALTMCFTQTLSGQVDPDKAGAWYMYFFTVQPQESRWGAQGDIQYRNWNLGGDLEQLLLRCAVSYTPAHQDASFALGYAHITSGAYGQDQSTSVESRIYQQIFLTNRIGSRALVKHRFRFEQRFVEDQDFRTRFRYNLSLTVPLNTKTLAPRTLYLILYDELFINGERRIGDNRTVEIFDRNRLYGGLGYVISPSVKIELGYMRQSTDLLSKDQLQVGVHQAF